MNFSAIHRGPSPGMAALVGLGDANAGGSASVALYLANTLATYPPPAQMAELGSEALIAVGINPGITTPDQAAQQVFSLAATFCQLASFNVQFGSTMPYDCGTDGGQAAAQAAYPQWLAYFQSLPANVWQLANQATNNPSYICPPGTYQTTPGNCVPSPGAPAGTPTAPTIVPPTPSPWSATPPIQTAPPQTPASVTPNSAPAAPLNTTNTTSTSDPLAFLTNSAIAGIPNWALIGGGILAIMILPGLLGGRR